MHRLDRTVYNRRTRGVNILVHDYLGIKLDRVWEIIKGDLSLLRAALLAAIED